MEDTMPKKTSTKTFIPQKSQVSKPPQKTWTRKDKLDEENQRTKEKESFLQLQGTVGTKPLMYG